MLSSSAAVESFTDAISSLEADKRRLADELQKLSGPVNVVAIHPAAQARYLTIVNDLAKALREQRPGSEMAASIRELIETATVIRTEPGQPLIIDVRGRLAGLLKTPVFPETTVSGGKVVAREGTRTPDPRIMIPVL